MEELWKNSAIIAKRNVDSNQTPISIALAELKQIIDIHSCIVLNQLPDNDIGITIDGFSEVDYLEDITTKTFKVDYANGVIYFHPFNIGKSLTVNYFGIGFTLLSASRIYTKYDKYGNSLETLEEVLDKALLQLKAIESLGGAVEIINKLDIDIKTGSSLHENLSNDVKLGTPLDASLKINIDDGKALLPKLVDANITATQTKIELNEEIEIANNTNTSLSNTNQSAIQTNSTLKQTIHTGESLDENLVSNITIGTSLEKTLRKDIDEVKTFKDTFNQDVIDGKILSPELRKNVIDGENINSKLEQTIATGKDSVDKINATGNKSLIISSSQFVNNEYIWIHNMNSEELHITMFDSVTKEPLMLDCKPVDKNSILVKNSVEHPNVKVVLSASYYQGNALFGTSVEEFAGESIPTGTKKVRLKDGNGVVENPITDSDSVFMSDGKTKLTKKMNDVDTQLADMKKQKASLNTYGYSKIKKKLSPPSNFTWKDAPIEIYKKFNGEISHNLDISKYEFKGKTYYIDPIDGKSGNSGLTPETPILNMQTAINKADCEVIVLADGIYYHGKNFSGAGISVDKKLTIKAKEGTKPIIRGCQTDFVYELVSGTTYSVARKNTGRVFDASKYDTNGDYIELVKKASILDAQNTPNSWYTDGTNVYINTIDGRIPDNNILLFFDNIDTISLTNNLFIKGIEIQGGMNCLSSTTASKELYVDNCKFKYSTDDDGLHSQSKLTIVRNSEAIKNNQDGFSYSGGNKVIEVDSIGRNNGNPDFANTQNGSTQHNGGKIIRVNCEYYNNKGSNCGDTQPNTQSWNLGCISHDSTSTEDRYNSNFTAHDTTEMWCDSCVSYGSINDNCVQDKSTMCLNYELFMAGKTHLEGTGKIEHY